MRVTLRVIKMEVENHLLEKKDLSGTCVLPTYP